MPALISEIIDTPDNFETIRDQIAAILAVELANQATLTGLEQPRVFVQRSNPWGEFLDTPEEEPVAPSGPPTPIINVWFDNANFDGAASNIVQRQKVDGVFNVDCYACAVSADDGENAGGHLAADRLAAFRAQATARIARQILMSGQYLYLGMRGVVWKRWTQSLTMFQPQIDNRQAQRVAAGRLSLLVQFNEFSPQNTGQNLELLSVEVKRAETGQVYLLADYPHT
jgi:hypothetical protein